ncbi:unnamed protein product [Symbiodinium natans]|uniref:Uncharacterized protein n=1 Tax=Symbiodinium natans TaxID=878477 RepID=A0A812QEH7_9DINO|nr:unnamed protein product [Symbiodinium natans]
MSGLRSLHIGCECWTFSVCARPKTFRTDKVATDLLDRVLLKDALSSAECFDELLEYWQFDGGTNEAQATRELSVPMEEGTVEIQAGPSGPADQEVEAAQEIAARLASEAAAAAKARVRSGTGSQAHSQISLPGLGEVASVESDHSTVVQPASGRSSFAQEVTTNLLNRLLSQPYAPAPAPQLAPEAPAKPEAVQPEAAPAKPEVVQVEATPAKPEAVEAAPAKPEVVQGEVPSMPAEPTPVPSEVPSPTSAILEPVHPAEAGAAAQAAESLREAQEIAQLTNEVAVAAYAAAEVQSIEESQASYRGDNLTDVLRPHLTCGGHEPGWLSFGPRAEGI